MIWFNWVDECVALAKEYINDEEKRYTIAEQGYVTFLENYTCKHFVEQVLKFAGEA